MKKISSFLIGVILVTPLTGAQNLNLVATLEHDYYYVPAEFTISGSPQIVIEDWDANQDNILKLYDQSLSNVANITIPLINEDTEGFLDMTVWNFNTGADIKYYIVVTQTLFNDDAEYEYIAPVISGDDEIVGIAVKTASGKDLHKIDLPGNQEFSDLCLTLIGDKRYLTIETKDDDYNYWGYYYEISATSGLREVNEPVKIKVSPTIINQSESIKVKVSELRDNTTITVTDIQGRILYALAADQSGTYQIPGSVMSKGVNIVTVSTVGKPGRSSKVIVR